MVKYNYRVLYTRDVECEYSELPDIIAELRGEIDAYENPPEPSSSEEGSSEGEETEPWEPGFEDIRSEDITDTPLETFWVCRLRITDPENIDNNFTAIRPTIPRGGALDEKIYYDLAPTDLSHRSFTTLCYLPIFAIGAVHAPDIAWNDSQAYGPQDNRAKSNGFFKGCNHLMSVDCSLFGNVTNANSFFSGCERLIEGSLTNMDFTCATNASSMFYKTTKLGYVDLSSFGNAVTAYAMFNLSGIEDITGADFHSLQNGDDMFKGSGLVSVDLKLPSFTSTPNMVFADCVNLTSARLSLPAENITHTFDGCTNLAYAHLDIPNAMSITYMFNGCSGLREVEFASRLHNCTGFGGVFKNCTSLEYMDLWFITYDIDRLTSTGLSGMFWGCSSLREVRRIPNCADISSMFYGCSSLTDVWDWEFEPTKYSWNPAQSSTWNFHWQNKVSECFSGCGNVNIHIQPDGADLETEDWHTLVVRCPGTQNNQGGNSGVSTSTYDVFYEFYNMDGSLISSLASTTTTPYFFLKGHLSHIIDDPQGEYTTERLLDFLQGRYRMDLVGKHMVEGEENFVLWARNPDALVSNIINSDGILIDQTIKGERGEQGPRGYSTYELDVQNGYQGTETAWRNSFIPRMRVDDDGNLYYTIKYLK